MVIDDAGLIVTIGYLITEAMAAEVTTAAGKASRAEIIGFDTESVTRGRAAGSEAIPIETAKGLAEKTPVIVAGRGGAEAAHAAIVVSRRAFAGYWEYLLEDAIFTAPPCLAWSGAALIAPDGKLAGIGSLNFVVLCTFTDVRTLDTTSAMLRNTRVGLSLSGYGCAT